MGTTTISTIHNFIYVPDDERRRMEEEERLKKEHAKIAADTKLQTRKGEGITINITACIGCIYIYIAMRESSVFIVFWLYRSQV